MTLRDRTAIVGVGTTDYYRRGQSLPQTLSELAGQAVLAAVADAGLSVEGAGDARLITNIVGCQPEEVEIEAAVQVVWDDLADATTVPRFVLAPVG